MSTRHVTPPSVKRWPFYLGDALLLAVAFGALAVDESPPTPGTMILVAACVLIGVGLLVAPYLLEFDARVRLAEAGLSDQLDAQARRLTQASEQLSHAVSRSQSTEEQVGQALGTLEDLSEKLSGQSEDLAQTLARAGEREVNELRTEIERLAHDRDQHFSALNAKFESITARLQETHAAAKMSISAQAKGIDEVHVRLDSLGARVEEIVKLINHLRATLPSMPGAEHGSPSSAAPAPHASRKDRHGPRAPSAPAPSPNQSPSQVDPDPANAATPSGPDASAGGPSASDSHAAGSSPNGPAAADARKREAKTNEASGELPLEGMPLPKSPAKGSRREMAGATSIVATAYIGIGNKLYLRGEGPGLSWEQGVPMQFLAIGKWGWTTTDAHAPVICRIFRNDDSPMLDADVVIGPGEKAEITPHF